MIRFVCCYNDDEVMDAMLRPSLEAMRQRGDVEFAEHFIDTRVKRYDSAAQAYNSEIQANTPPHFG